MYPNPPHCEKCRKAMHHVATMPNLIAVAKFGGRQAVAARTAVGPGRATLGNARRRAVAPCG
jgi:hypothetical protein